MKISMLFPYSNAKGSKTGTAIPIVPSSGHCNSPAVETVSVWCDGSAKIREQGFSVSICLSPALVTQDYLWLSPLPQHLQFWDKKHAPEFPLPLQLKEWKLALFEIQGVFTVDRNNPNVEQDLLLTVNPLSPKKTRVNAGNKLPFILYRDNASLSLTF